MSILTIPGLTWQGHRDPATAELAIRVDGAWMHALKHDVPVRWWDSLIMNVPSDPSIEATRLPIDFEDLADFEEDVGQVVAKEPTKLTSVLIPRKPWVKSRAIPTADLTKNQFAGWPDRLAAILLSSRRMEGALVRELLYQATTKVMTYQGVPLIGTGHRSDPTNPDSDTFDNLHTGVDDFDPQWDVCLDTVFGRLGPGGYPLDLKITYVIGGTAMRKHFDRKFKRGIVLADSAAKDASAGVTNVFLGGDGVIPIVTAQLDRHPWLLGAGVGKQQWFTVSTTYQARPLGLVSDSGGAPVVKILDVGTDYEVLNNAILIVARMSLNGGGAFPHVIDEWRSTVAS